MRIDDRSAPEPYPEDRIVGNDCQLLPEGALEARRAVIAFDRESSMRRSADLPVAIVLGILAGPGTARALVVPPVEGPAYVAPAGFEGRIPTEDSPISGEDRLARMRRDGRLPDSFTRDGCRYLLAGDPAMAYYVKQCPRRR